MSVASRILNPKTLIALALGAAIPFAASAAKDPASAPQSTAQNKAAPPKKPRNPLHGVDDGTQCHKVQTDQPDCKKNAYGDEECTPVYKIECAEPN